LEGATDVALLHLPVGDHKVSWQIRDTQLATYSFLLVAEGRCIVDMADVAFIPGVAFIPDVVETNKR